MALNYYPYRKKPWVLTWNDPWSGARRIKGFADEPSALHFDAVRRELAEQEKAIIRRARKKRAASKISLADLLVRYVAGLGAPSSRLSSGYHIRPLVDVFGQRQAARIGHADIIAWMEMQRVRAVGESTIARRIAILRAALNWAVSEGLLTANPLAGLKLPQSRSRRIDPPTINEARLILRHAAPHVQRVIVLSLATGARVGPSELFRLWWSDVDLEAGSIRMPTAAKGGAQAAREIPVRPELLSLLQQWHVRDTAIGCPYVINYDGKPVKSISTSWHAALRRAGIRRRVRPYDLRHAFATLALAGGADPGGVAEIMAHKPSMLFNTYQHVTRKQKIAAIKAVPLVAGKELVGI